MADDPQAPDQATPDQAVPEQAAAPAAPPEWGDVADKFQAAYPTLDPDYLKQRYEAHRKLAQTRQDVAQAGETGAQKMARLGTPFASAVGGVLEERAYGQARQRFDKGTPDDSDYYTIARHERNVAADAQDSQTLQGAVVQGAYRTLAFAGEMAVAGAAEAPTAAAAGAPGLFSSAGAFAKGAAGFAGRTAARTALTPSMYAEQAARNNVAAGRDALDPRGLPSAYGLALAQQAVLEGTGALTGKLIGEALPSKGLLPAAARLAAHGAAYPVGQAATDIATSGIDDAAKHVLGTSLGLDTGYGTVGEVLQRHDPQGALRSATVQALTAAVFHAAHGGGPEGGERVIREFAEKLQAQAKGGAPADAAGRAMLFPHQLVGGILQHNPDPNRVTVEQAVGQMDPGPSRDWGATLASLFPATAPGHKPAGGVQPVEGEFGPQGEAALQRARQPAPQQQAPPAAPDGAASQAPPSPPAPQGGPEPTPTPPETPAAGGEAPIEASVEFVQEPGKVDVKGPRSLGSAVAVRDARGKALRRGEVVADMGDGNYGVRWEDGGTSVVRHGEGGVRISGAEGASRKVARNRVSISGFGASFAVTHDDAEGNSHDLGAYRTLDGAKAVASAVALKHNLAGFYHHGVDLERVERPAAPKAALAEAPPGMGLETMRSALKALGLDSRKMSPEKVRSEAKRLGIDQGEVRQPQAVQPQKAATYEAPPEAAQAPPGLKEVLAGWDDPAAQTLLRHPQLDEIAKHVPPGSKPLGAGGSSVALRTPEGDVVRVGLNVPRPNIPEVLQPKSRQVVRRTTAVERLPFVDTKGITGADVQDMTKRLAARGYDFVDPQPENLGRTADGRLVVLDAGAVAPAKEPAEITLHHGTQSAFDRFDPAKAHEETGVGGRGFFFSEDPQAAKFHEGWGGTGTSPRTVSVKVPRGRIIDVNEARARFGEGDISGRLQKEGFAGVYKPATREHVLFNPNEFLPPQVGQAAGGKAEAAGLLDHFAALERPHDPATLGMVSMADLRERSGLPREEFDRQLKQLRRDGVLRFVGVGDPGVLPAREKAAWIEGPSGKESFAHVERGPEYPEQPGASAEERPTAEAKAVAAPEPKQGTLERQVLGALRGDAESGTPAEVWRTLNASRKAKGLAKLPLADVKAALDTLEGAGHVERHQFEDADPIYVPHENLGVTPADVEAGKSELYGAQQALLAAHSKAQKEYHESLQRDVAAALARRGPEQQASVRRDVERDLQKGNAALQAQLADEGNRPPAAAHPGAPAADAVPEAAGRKLAPTERARRGRAVPKQYEQEAVEAGIDPEHLHSLAREIQREDRPAVEQHNQFLARAEQLYDHFAGRGRENAAQRREGKGLPSLRGLARKGKTEDPASVPSWDVISRALQADGNFSGMLSEENHAEEALARYNQGRRKPVGEEGAYRQALDFLVERKGIEDEAEKAQRAGSTARAAGEAVRSGQETGEAERFAEAEPPHPPGDPEGGSPAGDSAEPGAGADDSFAFGANAPDEPAGPGGGAGDDAGAAEHGAVPPGAGGRGGPGDRVAEAQARYDNRDQTARGGGLFGGDDLQGRQGFSKLPDGAPVLFVEGQFKGRTGSVIREGERIGATVEGHEGAVPIDPSSVEPLNPWQSWRTTATTGPQQQGGLFNAQSFLGMAKGLLEDEGGHLDLSHPAVQGFAADLERRYDGLVDFIGKLGGKKAPKTARLDRDSADSIARFDGAHERAAFMAPLLTDLVLGRSSTPESDRLFGAVLTERRLRWMRTAFDQAAADASGRAADLRNRAQADADQGFAKHPREVWQSMIEAEAKQATRFMRQSRDVTSTIGWDNSPLKTFEDYKTALKSPPVQEALKRWDALVVPEMEKNFRTAQGLDDDDPIHDMTQVPGSPMNLKGVAPGEEDTETTARRPGSRGNLRAPRLGRFVFAQQAKGNADAYDLSAAAIIRNSLDRGYKAAAKAEMYRTMEAGGVAQWGRPGQKVPGFTEFKDVNPPPGTQEAKAGETAFYVRDEAQGEFRQVLGTDKPFPQMPGSGFFNAASLASAVEPMTHLKNQIGMLIARPGMSPKNFVTNALDVLAKDKGFVGQVAQLAGGDYARGQGRLADLARIGAVTAPQEGYQGKVLPEWMKAGGLQLDPTHYLSKVVEVTGQAMRITADDAFDRMKQIGLAAADEGNRRDFINQLGNYSKRTQSQIVAVLRDTGVGPFATAGAANNVQAMRSLLVDPGMRATDPAAALQLRARMLGRTLAVASVVPLLNYLAWGRADGDDKTPLLSVKLGTDATGRTHYLPVANWLGLDRGAKAVGALAFAEGARTGRGIDHSADKAVEDFAETWMHPAMGPYPTFGYTWYTGKNAIGIPVAQHAKHGQSQSWENFKAAFGNANPVWATATGVNRPESQQKRPPTWADVGEGLTGPFVRTRKTPPGKDAGYGIRRR